jgi:peptide/nickel transport system ATP-binding protein
VTLLEVADLKVALPSPGGDLYPVDGVSFTVNQGETLGVVGESGSGKTLTGLSIIRLLPSPARIASGTVRLGSRDLTACSEGELRTIRGNEIGMVFQDPMTSLNPTMTVGKQIVEAVRAHRDVGFKQARGQAIEALASVGIDRPARRFDEYPHQLSGGLRQRVVIAMAVVCRPRLLIADEPTTALDVTVQTQVLDLIDDLKSQYGMSVLLITHDMGVIAGRADRVQVMYAGQLVESGGTAAVFDQPRHRYTTALLDSIPSLDHDPNVALTTIQGSPPELANRPLGCRFSDRCLYATEACRAEQPPLVVVGGSHNHACVHPSTAVRAAAPVLRTGAGDRPAIELQPDSASAEPMLELEGVSMEFGHRGRTFRALDSVSVTLHRGETLAIVGESGSGKTTLGRIAVGLLKPSSGAVRFEGRDLAAWRRRERRRRGGSLQMMFQDLYGALDPRMRVRSIVREPLTIQRVDTGAVNDGRVRELLKEVGLPAAAVGKHPHEFSGGQRQRIGLARALALTPDVIVADEPVSALDVSVRSQILNLMKRLQHLHGLSYIVISHDLSIVRYLADRIAVMYQGRIVEIGRRDDILHRPQHPYTGLLLRAVPIPDPRVERSKHSARAESDGEPVAVADQGGCDFRFRCPRAQELCRTVAPPLTVQASGSQVACHFASEVTTAAEADTAPGIAVAHARSGEASG